MCLIFPLYEMCLFPLAYYKLFPAFSTVAMTCRGVLFCVVSPVWGASASVGGELSAILKLHTITYVFTSPMSSNHPNPALSLLFRRFSRCARGGWLSAALCLSGAPGLPAPPCLSARVGVVFTIHLCSAPRLLCSAGLLLSPSGRSFCF